MNCKTEHAIRITIFVKHGGPVVIARLEDKLNAVEILNVLSIRWNSTVVEWADHVSFLPPNDLNEDKVNVGSRDVMRIDHTTISLVKFDHFV